MTEYEEVADLATNANGLIESLNVMIDKVQLIPLAAVEGDNIDLVKLINANDTALRGLVGHISRLTVVVVQMAAKLDE